MRERHPKMAGKRTSDDAKSQWVFGQARKPAKLFRAGLYARVSTNGQQTIPLQVRALREYAARRGWTIALDYRNPPRTAFRTAATDTNCPPVTAL